MSIPLLLGGIFLITFFLGILLEKVRVPWIFAALILGLIFAFRNPFSEITSSETFQFLAWLGMYFLLFLIGFELDLEKIKKLGRFIIKSTFFIILFEALFGTLLIHFVFARSWFISILTALSFATVGEAVLIPILDEFGLTKTRLGQTILGIGVFDDVIEIFVIILAVLAIPILLGQPHEFLNIGRLLIILPSLSALFLFTLVIIKSRKEEIFLGKIRWMEMIFLLILAIFFLFIGLGKFAEAAPIGALLAGIAAKNSLPQKEILAVESQIKTLTYAFFSPIFFFWVGVDTNVGYLLKAPLLVLLVILVTYSAKILACFLVTNKELGKKSSLFMGVSLGVRFSTSIVIIKFLFEKTLIGGELYSVLIASTIAFKFIIPFLLSFLISKWKMAPKKDLAPN